MFKKVLDIWTVQKNKCELVKALHNLKNDDVVVFENACVELKIGDRLIPDKIFNTIIYSENSDIIILVSKYSNVTCEDVKSYLEKFSIKYNLVNFVKEEIEDEVESIKNKTPEIWFARDSFVVGDALNNSIRKKVNRTFTFDREIDSSLEFQFFNTQGDYKLTFDSRIIFTGMITLEDKIILITRAVLNGNKKLAAIEKVLEKNGFIENINKTL